MCGGNSYADPACSGGGQVQISGGAISTAGQQVHNSPTITIDPMVESIMNGSYQSPSSSAAGGQPPPLSPVPPAPSSLISTLLNILPSGFGVSAGGQLEAGTGVSGVAGAASAGIGTLFSNSGEVSAIQFVTAGATVLGAGNASGYPPQYAGAWILGAFAGGGASAFITNARTPSDFGGPSSSFTFNAGVIPALSIQLSVNTSGIYQISVSPPMAGYGLGTSLSFFSQHTTITSSVSNPVP